MNMRSSGCRSSFDYQKMQPTYSSDSNTDVKREIGCMVIQCSGAPNNSDLIRRFLYDSSSDPDPFLLPDTDYNVNQQLTNDAKLIEKYENYRSTRGVRRRLGRDESRAACLEVSKLSINDHSNYNNKIPLPHQDNDIASRNYRPISRQRRTMRQNLKSNCHLPNESRKEIELRESDQRVNDSRVRNQHRLVVEKQRCKFDHEANSSGPRKSRKSDLYKNEKQLELTPKSALPTPSRLPRSAARILPQTQDQSQQQNSSVVRRKPLEIIEKNSHREECRFRRQKEPESVVEARPRVSKSRKTFSDLYQVQDMIGVGGCGVVYAGIRTEDYLPVAIKHVPKDKVKRWEKVRHRSVPQEIALMMRVSKHRSVVKLLDWFEGSNFYTMVLERPQNCVDLFDYIQERHKLKEREACQIFKQVLSAVHYIHSRGVVHRDIKDENIILNHETTEVKVIDFGCGTLLHDGYYKDFAGTPEFYPPEWFNEHRYQAETATVWSLGVLLYGMVCGEIPFKTNHLIAQGKFDFKVNLSSEIRKLISWMLRKRPEERPTLVDISEHPWLWGRKT